jgi:hypothetical protein
MKKLSLLLLAAGMFCSSCQQAPRPVIQTEVPMFTTKEIVIRKKRKSRPAKIRVVTETTMVSVSGPSAKEWDMFDRTDALIKYNEMPLKDKEVLFETIARVYGYLPEDNTHSYEAINTGIWKEITDKGINLSFDEDPADWNPYLMYIQPLVIAEMTDFYIKAKPESISNKELDLWQKAICNLINTRPDNITMAILLSRKDALEGLKRIFETALEGARIEVRDEEGALREVKFNPSAANAATKAVETANRMLGYTTPDGEDEPCDGDITVDLGDAEEYAL